ncbi:penicillin-binding protein activator LpoB [Pseudomonas sp. UMAB-40]|uniref:penicillin-binding protein activator LpoB n=1 Tax=Pseudomonas sp. UMAB-40 TaxID=1365407 RepID=UPI001C56E71E|nr:penicillin-binding protein activator LpoB [Pseudomonas sp. UMAB-40]
MRAWIGILALACAAGVQAAPKIAVTDLAYEASVDQYVHVVSARDNHQQDYYGASGSSSYDEYTTQNSYLEQTEIRRFSGDIKGQMLKTGMFQLIQGSPYTASAKSDVYDVIKRIKAGDFKGADYVLFGTLSDIDFTQDMNELANTDSYSAVLALTLVADFSLINTQTYEITSAFTAMGEAQDTKLVNDRDIHVSLNRPRVVRDVSRSLGEQLGDGSYVPSGQPQPRNDLPPDTAPVILR